MRHLLAALLLASCATTPKPEPTPTGSRGLRAPEHLDAADRQDQLAREDLELPDVRASGMGRVDQAQYVIPWTRSWNAEADHERLAKIHRGAAAQLHAEYDEACAGRPDPAVSPIERYAIGGSPTATGAVVYLSADAGTPDHLLADMRCHRAWMMVAHTGMDDCPLDLADIHVTARGDRETIEVTITIDPAFASELHRRVAVTLESTARRSRSQ